MFKEIVTKAVIGKGKKVFKNNYTLMVDNNVNTILGCWVINHEFKGLVNNDKVINYIKLSENRVDSVCPYFGICGGCNLLHTEYKNTIDYKKAKVKNILKKFAHIEKDIEVIENKMPFKIYLLDIETPSASGIDIARKIRSKDVDSVIIFLTGAEINNLTPKKIERRQTQ